MWKVFFQDCSRQFYVHVVGGDDRGEKVTGRADDRKMKGPILRADINHGNLCHDSRIAPVQRQS